MNKLNTPISIPSNISENKLRVIPLGGLGEVGRNCCVLEMIDPIPKGYSKLLLLDCGVLFPGEDEPGVDLLLPDFSYLLDKLDRIEAVCLTHGHEDHIGAVPFLLKLRNDIPVVGTKYTLGLLKEKLLEHKIENFNLVEIKEEDHIRFGPFALEFFAVTHSIPDAIGITIKTAYGNVIDTGDFKIDQNPLDGRITDLGKIHEIAKTGIDLFMTDSTNAMRKGFVESDQVIIPEIEEIFKNSQTGAIVATTFASNIHRIQIILNAALNNNRKVVFLGRSMIRNTDVALLSGHLNIRPEIMQDLIIDIKDANSLPRDRVCIICTGSQGEELSALGRMSTDSHPFYNLECGDVAIFASSLVPGNEKSVSALINRLIVKGVKIFDSYTNKIHTSGHSNAGELAYIYNIVKPYNVLPIHGEPRMLIANRDIAINTLNNKVNFNVPDYKFTEQNAIAILNGFVLDIENHKVQIVGRYENGYIYVDGRMDSVTEKELKHRRILSEEGFLVVSVIVDFDAKKVISHPKISAIGIAEKEQEFIPLANKVKSRINRALNEENIRDNEKLQYILQNTSKSWLRKNLRRFPMVMPVITAYNETLV